VAPAHPDATDEALIGLNKLATVARLWSGAAHDVNNALQVISGTVEILEMRTDLPAQVTDALGRLRTQSNRAAAALAQVIAFTRAGRGTHAPVSLKELAAESLALRDFAIRRARLSSRLECDSQAPLVTGNRGDLQQVVLNLIVNAEQALTGTQGTIVVHIAGDGDGVSLRVSDAGPGLQIEQPERVFEPFVTTHDPFESAGLGLWASRVLVEQHGGTLTLAPRSSGAEFVMQLPAMRRSPAPDKRSIESR
jgi:signal transduction histidine kinase